MADDGGIDELLAGYLQLLDTYTILRTELSELQSSVYHSLARANFSAERGIRYGQDFYDERMQAMKVLDTEKFEGGLPAFSLVDLNAGPADGNDGKEGEEIVEKLQQATIGPDEKDDTTKIRDENLGPEAKACSESPRPRKSKDPLRWFGILSPPSLRQAQDSASALVETAVKLSSVDAEMKGMEIEIRRARKRKVRNKKAVEKEQTARGTLGGQIKVE